MTTLMDRILLTRTELRAAAHAVAVQVVVDGAMHELKEYPTLLEPHIGHEDWTGYPAPDHVRPAVAVVYLGSGCWLTYTSPGEYDVTGALSLLQQCCRGYRVHPIHDEEQFDDLLARWEPNPQECGGTECGSVPEPPPF